jgi:hypothetical protein
MAADKVQPVSRIDYTQALARRWQKATKCGFRWLKRKIGG